MGNIILSAAISGLLFLTFVFLLIFGLWKKTKKPVYISIIFLGMTILFGIWTGYLMANKAYKKIKNVKFENPYRPGTGNAIYIALFGESKQNCVEVINKMDQTVPRLDCCIWLEFRTCPKELSRIIALVPYQKILTSASDTTGYIPDYSPRPDWFKPKILGDSMNVLQNYNVENPNRNQILIFSKDSTHAFYCDMAD